MTKKNWPVTTWSADSGPNRWSRAGPAYAVLNADELDELVAGPEPIAARVRRTIAGQ